MRKWLLLFTCNVCFLIRIFSAQRSLPHKFYLIPQYLTSYFLLWVYSYTFFTFYHKLSVFRSSPPQVLSGKGILKICGNFTREHPSIPKCDFNIGLFSCKFAAYFRTLFLMNTSGGLFLRAYSSILTICLNYVNHCLILRDRITYCRIMYTL